MRHNSSEIAAAFASRNRLMVMEVLGAGIHGCVYLMQRPKAIGGTALKVFQYEAFFRREVAVYERLMAASVHGIRGFAVPQLIGTDEQLLALEMTVVGRPFVLDFAGAFLDDQAPEFDREVWEAWEDENREAFGDRWREVNAVLEILEGHGIHMLDVNPGNIAFAD